MTDESVTTPTDLEDPAEDDEESTEEEETEEAPAADDSGVETAREHIIGSGGITISPPDASAS